MRTESHHPHIVHVPGKPPQGGNRRDDVVQRSYDSGVAYRFDIRNAGVGSGLIRRGRVFAPDGDQLARRTAAGGRDRLYGGRRRVFGAVGHRFVLHPVLTGAELADLEQDIGVCLPAEYRSFLLDVGNGGAGPGYGLERVERTVDGWRWTGDGVTTVGRLGVPFRPSDPRVYEEHAAQRPVEREFSDPDAFTQAGLAWVQRLDDLYDEETFGTVALAHQGCGYFWLLVVSGPERGTVWDDSRAADIAPSPLTGPDGGRLSFGQWYLDWLARTEAAVTAADES